jgi:hypothetical protein
MALSPSPHFWSAVMVSQAVTEGIWRLVLERNQVQADRDRPPLASTLVERRILSAECAEALGRIWRSFRNDVHHMNPSVTGVPFSARDEHKVGSREYIQKRRYAHNDSKHPNQTLLEGVSHRIARQDRCSPAMINS